MSKVMGREVAKDRWAVDRMVTTVVASAVTYHGANGTAGQEHFAQKTIFWKSVFLKHRFLTYHSLQSELSKDFG